MLTMEDDNDGAIYFTYFEGEHKTNSRGDSYHSLNFNELN